ncbi:MAG: phosphodiester glycosidase family protein [Armatimonadetes bacterium]|nr:phosphodiester glycosidase family protein [Armatimonadota bacterium]
MLARLAPGVTYREDTYLGTPYHLVTVDRSMADAAPRPYRTDRDGGETVSAIDRRTDAVATLNGTFFDTARPGRVIFGEVKNDETAYRPAMTKKRTYWAVRPDATMEMEETERTPDALWAIPSAKWNSFRYVLGGGGRLIQDGRKTSVGAGDNDQRFQPDVLARRNRSAIGFSEDGRHFWMVACDPPGWTPQQTADFFLTLGADEAMFLDGGGSTEMVADDRIVNDLTGGGERRMPTAIVTA